MGFVQLMLIVVIFAVVGPVVGTLVLAILLSLINGSLSGVAQVPLIVLAGLFTGASHALGGIPAAIAGVIVGIKQAWFDAAGWRYALGAGALVGAGLELLASGPFIKAGNADLIGVLFAVATITTLVCWRLVSSWSFVREANP